MWLLATVGEEGLGNLCGVSAALDDPPAQVAAFVAVEGNYLGRISTVGVGSVRRRVRVRRSGRPRVGGGRDAERRARARAARRVHRRDPRRRGTSVNVGRIGGGEGINMRAREAWFELDLRADDPDALAALGREVEDLLGRIDPPLAVDQDELGDRPAGHVDPDHPLVRAATEALTRGGHVDVVSRHEHRCERRARARHPGDRRGRHHGIGRAHARRSGSRRRRSRTACVRWRARSSDSRSCGDDRMRSGVVLQGAYPPGEFRSMVERIDALGSRTCGSPILRCTLATPTPTSHSPRRRRRVCCSGPPSRTRSPGIRRSPRSRPRRWTRSPTAA